MIGRFIDSQLQLQFAPKLQTVRVLPYSAFDSPNLQLPIKCVVCSCEMGSYKVKAGHHRYILKIFYFIFFINVRLRSNSYIFIFCEYFNRKHFTGCTVSGVWHLAKLSWIHAFVFIYVGGILH